MKTSLLLLPFLLVGIVACSSSSTPENVYRKSEDGRPLVDDKYSLQADRKSMEDLRAQVPNEKKRENDELALTLGLMSETKKSPSDIRSQFDSILRKKRSLFDKDMTKERENFTKEERKKRDEFMKSQRDQRETFQHSKHTREEQTEFFRSLDEKRSEFFSVERDRRADYESDVRERRKSFDDYAREKQNEFNQEIRAYQKRYDDMKKEEREKEKAAHNPQPGSSTFASPGAAGAPSSPGSFGTAGASGSMSDEARQLEEELAAIRNRPGTMLKSGESGE
jgi:hypothetical protein